MAIDRSKAGGRVVNRATEATAPSDATATSGHDPIILALQIFNRGNQPEIDRAIMQPRRAPGRDIEPQIEEIAALLQPMHERTGVQILDRADSDRTHDTSGSYQTVERYPT